MTNYHTWPERRRGPRDGASSANMQHAQRICAGAHNDITTRNSPINHIDNCGQVTLGSRD